MACFIRVMCGKAMSGEAVRARCGMLRFVGVRCGEARSGIVWQLRLVKVGSGTVRRGWVWLGRNG